jgi:cell division protein FtsI/penicillin-binding protein 2
MVNGGILVQPHVVAGPGGETVSDQAVAPILEPGLSDQLNQLMEHVLRNPWYVEDAQVPGYWVGGKTGTAQVWDAEHRRWAPNLYNFSCVGFIGRREGRPDLVVAVRIQEARPGRNEQGQLLLPVTSTELFRRVATDAVTTPGLLPVLPPPDPVVARGDR